MTSEPAITESLLTELAAELDLPIDSETADDFVEPISDIIESMEPVARASGRDKHVNEVEFVDAEDPYNAFITHCNVSQSSATGTLEGVSIALKDVISLAGVPLTAGSGMLEGYVPKRNAPAAERLLNAGARIVGKTNMDEFAFGPTGETSYFGATKNPVDPEYTPGGSSSGSAAAVAAGDADLALGTDTGGSVRIPASYCGVFGFKPTQGLFPTEGVVELAGSLDTVGILGTAVDDIVRCTATLADEWDGMSRPDSATLDNLSIGVPDSLFADPVSEEVAGHTAGVIDELVSTGVARTDVSLPSTTVSSAVWRVITMSEIYMYFYSDALPYRIPGGTTPPFAASFRGARQVDVDRLSDPLKWYLLTGAVLVTHDHGRRYGNALARREKFTRQVDAVLDDVDVLVSPATPTTAFAFGEFSRDTSPPINNNTHLFNLTGHPAISVPCGRVDGLPIGFQIVGKKGDDATVLRVAKSVYDKINAT